MSTSLVHDALIYESDTDFVDSLRPFALEGLEYGEEVVVVSRPQNCDLLRQALGESAGEVRFVDAREWYQQPARTIARYQEVISEARSSGTSRLRVVGEVEFGETNIDHAEWTRYEAVLNLALRSQPAWIICPYDARRLPEQLLADAGRTHPSIIQQGSRGGSTRFEHPAAFAPAPMPVQGRLLEEMEVNGSLKAVRELVARTSVEMGLSSERAAEMAIVVNEITTNAILHGEPPIRLRSWSNGEALVYEITDAGAGPDDPLVGFVPPDPHQVQGRGLWLSRQLADRLEIEVGSGGTAVRVAARRG